MEGGNKDIYIYIYTQYKLIIIRAQRVIFAVGFKKQSESHSKSIPCITHPLKFAFALPLLQTATVIAPVKYFLKNILKVLAFFETFSVSLCFYYQTITMV